MRCRGNYRAQSTLEYALIIAVVVAGLVAMQIYMKRGVQGKLRESADQIGEQFEANNTTVNRTTNRSGTTVQEVLSTGESTSYTGVESKGAAEVRTEDGTENVGAWE